VNSQRLFFELYDFIYLILYQINLIVPYWLGGLLTGSIAAVYLENYIERFVVNVKRGGNPFIKIICASLLGAISPVTMHGMVPLLMVMKKTETPEYILSSFIITSVLINPNIVFYSMALGKGIALLRLAACVFTGVAGGVLVKIFYKNTNIFAFNDIEEGRRANSKRDLKTVAVSFKRGFFKTAPNLFTGIILTALFDKYFPKEIFDLIFAHNIGLGVLFSTILGVPLYFCGGGTITLIKAWLDSGMSIGSVISFVITGPATKFNNLTAIKNMVNAKFVFVYLAFTLMTGLIMGIVIDLLFYA
jgi:uncharacterized membrane protein YraQ (UPF0718 family)